MTRLEGTRGAGTVTEGGGGAAVEVIAEAARRLRVASATRVPCAPVRGLIRDGNVADAYAVQQLNNDLERDAGRRPVGWKIGLTSRVVQDQLGVDQPDFGLLFADTSAADGEPIPAGRLLQPRLEAEVAFVLEHDLDRAPVTAVDVLRATGFVTPAIEIVDSRVADWDISIVDTVADNASAGMFVIGPKPTRLTDVDLHDVRMTLHAGDRLVAEGTGAACLGHPVNAVVWLANTMVGVGSPLRAGDLVLSGSLGPLCPVELGVQYEAVISGLGSVRTSFQEAHG